MIISYRLSAVGCRLSAENARACRLSSQENMKYMDSGVRSVAPSGKAQIESRRPIADSFLLFLEVLVLKDIGSCTNQTKADFLLAGFAVRKALAADHNNLVSLAVFTIVEYFVDAGLADNFSAAITPAAIRSSSPVARALNASRFELKCDFPR
jgi:hypothetical protein